MSQPSSPENATAPGEILELFKEGYLSIAEAVEALDKVFSDAPRSVINAQCVPNDHPDDEDHMMKISALIARLQSTLDQFGDTCVYIRRGGLSWGAVALNRQDDDRKHGVFDLQAQHDRDMEQRAGQVERLIADRNRWMERAMEAEAKAPACRAAIQPQQMRDPALSKCEYCGDGKSTGLPGNACENCMNTGYKYPDQAELALAAFELGKLPGDVYWLLAKGRTRPDEPLWAVQITDHDANKIAEAESDHPADCVRAAASSLTRPECGEVDPTRPACGQGDEHGRKPTDKGYGHD